MGLGELTRIGRVGELLARQAEWAAGVGRVSAGVRDLLATTRFIPATAPALNGVALMAATGGNGRVPSGPSIPALKPGGAASFGSLGGAPSPPRFVETREGAFYRFARTLAKLPPVSVLVGQQMLSYGGVGPLLKYAGDRAYAGLSGRPIEVALSYPDPGQLARVAALAITFGFVVNGARGVGRFSEATLARFPRGLARYVRGDVPPDFAQMTPVGQLAGSALRGGLIGTGIFLKTRYGRALTTLQPVDTALRFLGLDTSGKVTTWAIETGVSMVYVPIMGMAMGKGFQWSYLVSGLILASVTNLSTTFLTSVSARERFAETNVVRQACYFVQSSLALLAGKGAMPPDTAYKVQLGIVSAGYLVLRACKSWLQRILGAPKAPAPTTT